MTWRRVLLAFTGVAALAGPPFRTDDPQPVDLGHLELYAFASGQGPAGVGPAVEFNYGVLADTQFHLVVPRAYDGRQGQLGDVEVGVKYRFLHETDTLPQIGVFPMVEVPVASRHTQVYLPLWIQKSWGPWTTYGGGGWWRNPGGANWTYAGWLLQRDLGEKLTLGAEVFRTSPGAAGFNAGGQVNFTEKHHLLFSAGRSDGQTLFYVGYQYTAGPYGNLGDGFRHK